MTSENAKLLFVSLLFRQRKLHYLRKYWIQFSRAFLVSIDVITTNISVMFNDLLVNNDYKGLLKHNFKHNQRLTNSRQILGMRYHGEIRFYEIGYYYLRRRIGKRFIASSLILISEEHRN